MVNDVDVKPEVEVNEQAVKLAGYLRSVADALESGECTDCVIVTLERWSAVFRVPQMMVYSLLDATLSLREMQRIKEQREQMEQAQRDGPRIVVPNKPGLKPN